MPYLEIATNIPRDRVTPEIVSIFSKTLSETIGKPEQYCAVRVIPDQLMSFGGTFDPCGSAILMSLGKLGVEENKTYASKIYAVVEKYLGIPNDRMYIQFIDKQTSEVGFKGTTFHQILGR
ncbi:macrophage migration inhibitory factor-like [Penaeus chinensis]|uniref:macrophage migration inhibitory factor-like n=1 Tax=Penaeus chinensis TaxID=139456 RepID=UPI001FB6A3BE|nr:macrophage migration inhibitory factor-like [Penaeus chinensis]XP_047475542.1 macrophage migration inhibitory factor-like [Penaeus chinensis]